MNRNKAALLALLCLACVLVLTACHTNTDPWPASSGTAGITQPAAENSQPSTNAAPEPTQAENTTVPSETVAPGLNG